MDSDAQSDNKRILQLIGAIVLESQDTERYLKMTVPFMSGEDTNLGATLKRHEKLKRRSLGELVGTFMQASTSDSADFGLHMERLVDGRNRVVHHFNETYGTQMAAGKHEEVIASLEAQLADLRDFRRLTEQLALHVLEALRDVTFRHTPEFEAMAELCESFSKRVAS